MEVFLQNLYNGNIFFGFFCLITILGALYVLFATNVLYACFGLLVSFLGVAGVFVFGGAEFVAAAQIMIYVGGILVLLIFGIMLSSSKELKTHSIKIENNSGFFTIIILFCLVAFILLLMSSINYDTKINKPVQDIKNLGFNLMTESVLCLEVMGILLLIALIGATFVAKKE
jgi:NADH-quinone oxidoreductase subunit J